MQHWEVTIQYSGGLGDTELITVRANTSGMAIHVAMLVRTKPGQVIGASVKPAAKEAA